jgi:predicted Zn-dependent protease
MYGLALSSLMLSQTAKAVEAAEALRRMTLAPSPMIDKLLSAARYADAKTDADKDAAIKLARDAAARFPLSRLTALHYVDLLQRDGRDAVAVAFLRDQLAITRSEITYYSLIAKSYAALGQRSLQHQAVAEAYALQGATAAAIEQLSLARKAADADFYTMAEIDARTRLLQRQLRDEREQLAREGRRPPDERSR